MKLTKQTKQWLDWFVGRAVKQGAIDESQAKKMTYQEKLKYLNWSDWQIGHHQKYKRR